VLAQICDVCDHTYVTYVITHMCRHICVVTYVSSHMCRHKYVVTHVSSNLCRHIFGVTYLSSHMWSHTCGNVESHMWKTSWVVVPFALRVTYGQKSRHTCVVTYVGSHMCRHTCVVTHVSAHIWSHISKRPLESCCLSHYKSHMCRHTCVVTHVSLHMCRHICVVTHVEDILSRAALRTTSHVAYVEESHHNTFRLLDVTCPYV